MYVELVLYLQDEANLIVMDDVFDVCLHTVCKHFIGDSVIYVHQGYWPSYVYTRFIYQSNTSFIEELGRISLLQFFKYYLNIHFRSLKVWQSSGVNHLGLEFLTGNFYLLICYGSAWVVDPSWLSFNSLAKIRILSISFRFSILIEYKFLNYSHNFPNFFAYTISLFISDSVGFGYLFLSFS